MYIEVASQRVPGIKMLNIPERLAREISVKLKYVQNILSLHAEGASVPFIARYRKERTGGLDEPRLRKLFERLAYLTELEERKKTILRSIEEQGKLTDALRAKIEAALDKTTLEDLYLPFRPKKRTRAALAHERGLEPLADFIRSVNVPESPVASLEEEAAKYVSPEKGVATPADALAGAADILAEEIAEKAHHRAYIRQHMSREAFIISRIKEQYPAGTTKFEMYRDFKARLRSIQAHNMLALLRGEHEGILTLSLQFDESAVLKYLEREEIRTQAEPVVAFYRTILKDAFEHLMRPALEADLRAEKKEAADRESIKTFEQNLRDLLLSSPAGMKPTMGVDPGTRNGYKLAIVSATGKFLHHETIFPQRSEAQRLYAAQIVRDLVQKYAIEMIAIGNGAGGREADEFFAEALREMEKPPVKVLVNESGAAVYASSHVAIEEFPRLEVPVRCAISIARRLQDPLSELVKVDPKSIGVGQYQHDVDQKLLKRKLEETVESCVNMVGVDPNVASVELLKYVSGLNKTLARNIVAHREQHGPFRTRQDLLAVPDISPKVFEQAAGFLQIRNGENPLDRTAIHPESYPIAERILADLGVTLERVPEVADKLQALDIKHYTTDHAGEPTVRDIINELLHPDHDPRGSFVPPRFQEGIKTIADLKPGMEVEGIVTNVANFGAFVNIGVHQDGLVHVSQLADKYVSDPKKIVKVGQIVKVRVLEVNEALKRISLSMKSPNAPSPPRREKPKKPPKQAKPATKSAQRKAEGTSQPKQERHEREPEQHYTLEDLKAKFNVR